MFDRPVYKCELLSITPDIRVNNDESYRKNIMNADTVVITTLLVQKTRCSNYFREIMTGKTIPAYRVITHDCNTRINGMVEHDVPKSPCFIKYDMVVGDEGLIISEDLEKATADEVRDYVFSHDKDRFMEELEEAFREGQNYYNESKAKGLVSDDKQIKKYLKVLNITRKL